MTEDKLNRPHSLFYLPMLNRFADQEWYIVHDIRRIFDNWQIDHWKGKKQNDTMLGRDGILWTLYYLDNEEEDDILELVYWNESYGIKMDRDLY